MLPWFSEHYGNPHSAEHVMGRAAEAAVETARGQVAALVGADPREIVFTSGATESNNIAIKGAARFAARYGDGQRRQIVTVVTEHKCVLKSVADLKDEGFDPVFLPVGSDGLLDPEVLRDALTVPTLLVSVMAVNNEIGVIQDISVHAAIAREAGALFHTDIAQAVGKIPVDLTGWKVDLASVSGHKIYGPKGVGALFVRRRPRARVLPLFSGGGQERGVRSGTLPAPLIVGLGEACRLADEDIADDTARIAALRDLLLERLREVDPRHRGQRQRRAPHCRQPERDLSGSQRAGHAGADAGSVRLHRVRLFLGRRRAVLCVTRAWPVRRRGRPHLAHRHWTLYLARRYRLRGVRSGGGPFRTKRRRPFAPRPFVQGLNTMPKMTFIERDGGRREVDAPTGLSVLEIAHKHKVDIEGACEGSLACSTCHVIVDPAWSKKLARATEDEEDMLDLAFGLTETSRLGCQIIMTDALDGLVVTLPAGVNNMYKA